MQQFWILICSSGSMGKFSNFGFALNKLFLYWKKKIMIFFTTNPRIMHKRLNLKKKKIQPHSYNFDYLVSLFLGLLMSRHELACNEMSCNLILKNLCQDLFSWWYVVTSGVCNLGFISLRMILLHFCDLKMGNLMNQVDFGLIWAKIKLRKLGIS